MSDAFAFADVAAKEIGCLVIFVAAICVGLGIAIGYFFF